MAPLLKAATLQRLSKQPNNLIPKNRYIELILPCPDDLQEILVAELDHIGFESILETDEGLSAYINNDEFNEDLIKDIRNRYSLQDEGIKWNLVEEKNWNMEWEKNFEPVAIDDYCYIRAPFHPSRKDEFRYELVILPKMSFGTGHHSTTYLMIKNQGSIDHIDKKVLDAGCGTAILAVMAEKLGAKEIIAYDIDEWSFENAPENVQLNNSQNIKILKGTIHSLDIDKDFNIILANINKNVLLEEIPFYSDHLLKEGFLLVSGFFKEDEKDLREIAENSGLKHVKSEYKDRWASILFKK